MSGRSSRSTLMLTNNSFITAAVASSSKLSCAITWHQWQAAYPTDNRIGLPVRCASESASGLQAHQATGLCLCCNKYGLVSRPRRFSGPVGPSPRRSGFGCAGGRLADDPCSVMTGFYDNWLWWPPQDDGGGNRGSGKLP